jgi:hypothetical protein
MARHSARWIAWDDARKPAQHHRGTDLQFLRRANNAARCHVSGYDREELLMRILGFNGNKADALWY